MPSEPIFFRVGSTVYNLGAVASFVETPGPGGTAGSGPIASVVVNFLDGTKITLEGSQADWLAGLYRKLTKRDPNQG
jgi:hypothetical protein